MTNLSLIRNCTEPVGLLKKLQSALGKDTLDDACSDMFSNLEKGSKAEMALELLYLKEPHKVEPPAYISEGLKWLEGVLDARKVDTFKSTEGGVDDA